jgi:hypothetical protein
MPIPKLPPKLAPKKPLMELASGYDSAGSYPDFFGEQFLHNHTPWSDANNHPNNPWSMNNFPKMIPHEMSFPPLGSELPQLGGDIYDPYGE